MPERPDAIEETRRAVLSEVQMYADWTASELMGAHHGQRRYPSPWPKVEAAVQAHALAVLDEAKLATIQALEDGHDGAVMALRDRLAGKLS